MSIKCVWASIDENGHGRNGKAGDQTGKEVKVGYWYNFGQNYVLRFKDRAKAKKAVEVEVIIANGNQVGYDQNQRTTLYAQMVKHKWNPDKIDKCETDCSALQAVGVNAAGIKVSKDIYTGNMVQALKGTGEFIVLKDKKYLTSDKWLMKGDIIVNTNEHTIMACEDGSGVVAQKKKAKKAKGYTGEMPKLIEHKDGKYIAKGDKSPNVKLLKEFLSWYFDADIKINQTAGNITDKYIKKFQTAEGLDADGAFGAKSLKKANKYKK
jgi:hypothetical protein